MAMAAKEENLEEPSSLVEMIEGSEEACEIEKPELILKEWNPQTHLLSKIPMKAQKGFTTFDLTLTCIAALPEFLVLGTNVGLVYWYNRKTGTLERLKIENPTIPVTCISVVSSVDYMLAAGTKNGIIYIFQIPKHFDTSDQLEEVNTNEDKKIPKKKQVQIFSVKDMHQSPLTALEWSTNGIKLFSGDASGVVTLTEMDYSVGQSKSIHLLDEKYEIVQLSYAQLNLVISSTFRTIIYATESKQSIKIGSQDRKFLGPFGAVLTPGMYSKSRKLYTTRPGLRIWVAGLDGAVQNTIIFKDLLANSHPNIPVINPMTGKTFTSSQDIQFGILYNFLGKYLVTWYKDILYVLDPENFKVIGSCSELKSILSVSICQDELFVLETGRNIIRISSSQDQYLLSMHQPSNGLQGLLDRGDAFIPDIMITSLGDFKLPDKPLNFLAAKLMETSRSLPKLNTAMFQRIRNVIEADLEIQDGQFTVLPLVIPLKEPSVPNITIQSSTLIPNQNLTMQKPNSEQDLLKAAEREKFDRISRQSFEDVVLAEVPARRKGGKRRKIRGLDAHVPEAIADSMSLSSHYSSNSEGDGTDTNTPTSSTLNVVTTAKRKSSTDSNCSNISQSPTTMTASTSEQNSPETSNGLMRNSIIPALENARFYNLTSSSTDLESKEEMLAKLLNWTDLLQPTRKSEQDFNGNNDTNLNSNEIEEDTLQIPSEGESEWSSIKTLIPEDVDSGIVDGCSSTTLDGSISATDRLLSDNDDNDHGTSHQSYDSSSSIDIYKNSGPESDTLSLTSAFSFGPPSGSSNLYYTTEESRTSSISGSSGAEDYRRDLEIQLGLVPFERSGDLIEASLGNLGLQDMTVDGIAGNDHWIQYKLPTPASSISVCEQYVISVDNQGSVFYSQLRSTSDVSLRWVKTDYSANQMALSPTGSVVWRIDTKRFLHSLTFPSQEGPFTVEGEWVQLFENVKFVALEESVGWIVKTDGSVHICKRIKDGLPIPKPYFELVPTQWFIAQLCTLRNHIWALTSDGRLLYRTRVSVVTPLGEEWMEIKLPSIPPIGAFGVGPNESLWLADIQNKIHFMSMKQFGADNLNNVVEEKHLWHVVIADYIFQHGNGITQSSSRHWKNRLVDSLRPTHLASFLQAKAVPLLGASSSSVWFTMYGTSSVYVNKTAVAGHRWETFSINSDMKTMKWSGVFAGSVYLTHGFLWLMNSKQKLYYCYPNDGKLQPVDLPPIYCKHTDGVVHVASAPEALWVLTSKGNIYGRCNMNSTNDLGCGWERIQLSPLENVRMVHLSCGSEVVWACDSSGKIYMRLGSLDPPCSNDISPAWVEVEGRANFHQGSTFTKVYVGTTGHMVWALDSAKNIFAREAVFPDLPIGTDWVHVSGIEAISLAISDTAVWALSPKGEIFRRYGISKTNFVGEYWRKISGTAVAITASLCDEIWALDANGLLLKHFQETQKFSSDSEQPKPIKSLDAEYNDWEFI